MRSFLVGSSTALSYIEQEEDMTLSKGAKKPILCSFGPETSKTLLENDLSPDLQADEPSMDAMITAVTDKLSS